MQKRIYLDNNASTPTAPEVVQAIYEHLQASIGNPSSVHAFGREAKQALTRARDSIAKYFDVPSREVYFTSSGTEAINMLLFGIMEKKGSGHIITSSTEHPAVRACVEKLEKNGYEASWLAPGTHGAVKPEQVLEAIRPDTKLITLMAANNETGVKTDLTAIAEIAEQHGIPFVVDGVALLGKEKLPLHSGITAICFSGQKIHASKGIGFAIVKNSLKWEPMIVGGGHEQGHRAGTENLPGIVGLAKAIELLKKNNPSEIERLRDRFEQDLRNYFPNLLVNGEGPRVCNTSNLAFPGIDGESLLTLLDMEGVAVSHGSACSSGGLEPSQILLNMGLNLERVRSSIRVSLSRYTTEEEIDAALAIFRKVLQRLVK